MSDGIIPREILIRHGPEALSLDLKSDKNVLLKVCPDYIHNYGLMYYIALWKTITNTYPNTSIHLSVPCDDNVGLALRSIKEHVSHITFTGTHPLLEKLIDIGQFTGVQVHGAMDPL